jgi:hypothetical protein
MRLERAGRTGAAQRDHRDDDGRRGGDRKRGDQRGERVVAAALVVHAITVDLPG